MNAEFVGNRVLYMQGSNDEKMSGIIQDLKIFIENFEGF